ARAPRHWVRHGGSVMPPTCRSPPTWRRVSEMHPKLWQRRSGWRQRPGWSAAQSRTRAATPTRRSTISARRRAPSPPPPIYVLGQGTARIAAAAAEARALPFPFTLTGRTENFLRGRLDLDDTIRRLQAYEAAGADALMAPGLPDLDAVRAVCAATTKPFNFMAGIKGKSFTVAALTAT